MSRISARLLSAKEDFLEDFKPKYVMFWLVTDKVISDEESQAIYEKCVGGTLNAQVSETSIESGSTEDQVEKLFEILATKGPTEFGNFIKILKMEDEDGVNYPWLAEKLMETNLSGYEREKIHSLKSNVGELLVDGKVPFPVNCLLSREKIIVEIRDKLKQASNERHWVVLHGMTGTGKSVLAAEVVRDNDLIEKYYPDGVFWLSLGILKDSNALEIKMKQLYENISDVRKDSLRNKYISTVENLNDLNQSMKRIVSKRMLVILDDLWDTHRLDVVKYFDIGCPILVTTKFPGEFNGYSQFTSKVQCRNDLKIDESKKLLSLYVNCETSQLPPVVDAICIKCRGSPFTLSHIGRRMYPYGNNYERWNYLNELLEKGLKLAIRHRHDSDELAQIKEVIKLTLAPPEIYEDKFLDFVIFPKDVWVPSKVFKVLWNICIFEVEDTMYNLLERSLVLNEKEPVNKNDPVYGCSYAIHDLYLEILKEICTEESISKRHEKLVSNYLQLCKKEDGSYDFSLLPDDDYIYYYIGYHMANVKNDNILDGVTLDDIYFDLKFIEKKLRLQTKDLLWDYQHYKKYFKNIEHLEIYRSFADKHMYDFNNTDCDIIQLGLFEPENSIIFQRALSVALKSKAKSYFKWCNREENQSLLQNLNLKLIPFKNTRHAAFSSDGLLIACVGSENKAYIFSRSSGEDLLTLSGHTAAINYCMFNSACNKLVTASDDTSVRIFEINIAFHDMKPTKKRSSLPSINTDLNEKTPDMSQVIFAQHYAKVLCCCYSHDEKLIVSSDENGYAHVWQSSTAYRKQSVHHVSKGNILVAPVKICCFNSDATLFATAAYDSIKLWHTDSGNIYKEFSYDEMPVSGFCWAQDLLISVANKEIFKNSITTGQCEKITCSKNLVITCCCISPDRNYLACGTSENTVIVYNINSKKLINNFKGHSNDILSVMYTEDGNTLLSVSTDGFILYDMAHERNTSFISSEGNLSVRQNLDDLIIASSNYFDCIEVRKGITAELRSKTDREFSEITACSLSNDELEVVYGTKDGSVKILNIQSNVIDSLPEHSGQINYITHFENVFFTCSEDKTLKIWNDRSSPKVLRGHQQSVLMCVPFKKSAQLLSCSKDGTLRVWDINSGIMKFHTEGHGNQDVTYCDISFDEKLLASASVDHTIKLWNAYNGELYGELQCKSEVRCCRFSPSFQILISGCDSGEVRLWHLGKEPKDELLCPHSSCVSDIYFNHDGSQFLTISDEIKIWKTGHSQPQTLLLPSSFKGPTRPSIWANDNFDLFVVILNSVMYVLQKIPSNDN